MFDFAGHVNALCFDSSGALLFAGDSLGVIKMWDAFANENTAPDRFGTTILYS